jgi:protein-disulfide isomerase
MPSGKRSKQMRRAAAAPPPVRAKGARGQRRASPRVLAAAGAVIALAVVGIVLGIVLGGGKSNSGTTQTNGSLVNALPGAGDVNGLLKGIPQRGMTLGAASAPVTLVEYIDLQCPYCEQLETQVMPDIIRRYVRPGKVKLEARVLDFIGPDSNRGRNAMIAAGRQGKAFNLAQLLYDNQGTENTGWLDDKMIERAAASIPGLNPRRVLAERNSAAVKAAASGFDRQATAQNVTGTPTLYVGASGAKGEQVALTSPTDEQALVQALDTALSS